MAIKKKSAGRPKFSSKRNSRMESAAATPVAYRLLDDEFFSREETDRLSGEDLDFIMTDSNSMLPIQEYLESPTRNGVWHLKAKWQTDGGISQYLQGELEKKFTNNRVSSIRQGRRSVNVVLSEKQVQEVYNIVRTRISFLNAVFAYMYDLELKKRPENRNRQISGYTNSEELILDLIDMSEVKDKFADAYDYFKKEIYFKQYKHSVFTNTAYRVKTGIAVLLKRTEKADRVHFISAQPRPLETIAEFLTKAGRITEQSLYPVFSPEESVFEPYFTFLEVSTPFIFKDVSHDTLLQFSRATREYSRQSYTNCVRAVGVIAEEYLTQVYETFFREPCPKGQTLGQAYDFIHASINKLFQSEPKTLPDLTPLYGEIKELLKQVKDSQDVLLNEQILTILREMLTIIKSDREYFRENISILDKQKVVMSCFPKYLRENLNELIRNRNAASHNTRIPIGGHESRRSVFCLMSLFFWWNAEKKTINWNESRDSILRGSIKRNSGVEIK